MRCNPREDNWDEENREDDEGRDVIRHDVNPFVGDYPRVNMDII